MAEVLSIQSSVVFGRVGNAMAAFALGRLGQHDQACITLGEVEARFPGADSVANARAFRRNDRACIGEACGLASARSRREVTDHNPTGGHDAGSRCNVQAPQSSTFRSTPGRRPCFWISR